jgi:hypothetical protein
MTLRGKRKVFTDTNSVSDLDLIEIRNLFTSQNKFIFKKSFLFLSQIVEYFFFRDTKFFKS